MQQHVERIHRENLAGIQEARAVLTAKAMGRLYDPKDETVRGTIPLYNLRNQTQRKSFLERIRPTDNVERDMDWGILSMIILDLEPFHIVNR